MNESRTLNTAPHLDAPDDFYEALIDSHRELDDEQSQQLNARLILLLANHIGDMAVLKQALAAARNSIRSSGTTQTDPSGRNT